MNNEHLPSLGFAYHVLGDESYLVEVVSEPMKAYTNNFHIGRVELIMIRNIIMGNVVAVPSSAVRPCDPTRGGRDRDEMSALDCAPLSRRAEMLAELKKDNSLNCRECGDTHDHRRR